MANDVLTIDGSYGEGGGQILRSALALSAILPRSFRIVNIRRNRKKPGLRPQHLTAVHAAQAVAAADVSGDVVGSTDLTFIPHDLRCGKFSFDTGTAGSTNLVLQTIMPMLLFCGGPSSVTLTGGTHNPMSPSYHYLDRVFAPLLSKLGCSIHLTLERCGFYPRGGGMIHARIDPCHDLRPLHLAQRGNLQRVAGISAVANLPVGIAERQRDQAMTSLRQLQCPVTIEIAQVGSPGKGTFLFLEAACDNGLAGFTSLGAIGKPAEQVGDEGARELMDYIGTGAALDPHAADQVILYLAFCPHASEFTTSAITPHLLTNLWLMEQFHRVRYRVEGELGRPGWVTIQGEPPVLEEEGRR